MKLLPACLHEESVLLFSVVERLILVLLSNIVADDIFLVFREEVGNLASVKQVVDVFKEGFANDLTVREKELLLVILECTPLEEVLNRFLEILFLVVFGDFDLECLHCRIRISTERVDESCQLCHRVPA